MPGKIIHSGIRCLLSLVAVSLMATGFTACSEEIDESNYSIATERTMADYISATPDLSLIKSVFSRVRLGNAQNASSLLAVLSARGNYTVFAPTNEAVQKYCLKVIGTEDVEQLSYDQARMIAYSCIIDNGNAGAYETSDFPVVGTFNKPNLNDRLLTVAQEVEDADVSFIINGTSKLIKENLEMSNGILHLVDAVVWQSPQSVAEMIQSANNMKIMGRLLKETGLQDSLIRDRDLTYEDEDTRDQKFHFGPTSYTNYLIPQRRYFGYTGFVEPDAVFARDWGIAVDTAADGQITNWDVVLRQLQEKIEPTYGVVDKDDLTSPDNALNRFVAYHFTDCKMPYDKLVRHFNEFGYQMGADPYNPQTVNYSVDVWDYYPTLGRHRALLKILQVPDGEHEIYLNRVAKYNNGIDGDYKEVSHTPYTAGTGINVRVFPDNGPYSNIALNGYYFPIDGILLNNTAVQNALGAERIRIDLSAMFPEVTSNNLRMGDFVNYPQGYLSNVLNVSEGSVFLYLMSRHSTAGAWEDHQGDEWFFSGLFDITLRLPPVPRSGTYEIRMGAVQNPYRGMAQLYFGDDPDRLQPTGLPLDLRQSTKREDNPVLAWPETEPDDEQTIMENEANLRNKGYMHAPQYFTHCDGYGDKPVRGYGYSVSPRVRRILLTAHMDADKTYYLRYKSALKKLDSEFFLDYFEFVPTNIYNGTVPEDIW